MVFEVSHLLCIFTKPSALLNMLLYAKLLNKFNTLAFFLKSFYVIEIREFESVKTFQDDDQCAPGRTERQVRMVKHFLYAILIFDAECYSYYKVL